MSNFKDIFFRSIYPIYMATSIVILFLYFYLKKIPIFNKGFSFLRKCKYEEAINEFTNELNKKPRNWILYQGIAYSYNMLGFFQNSINNYEKVLELGSKSIGIYFELAILYAEENKFDIAFDFIEKGKCLQKKAFIFNRVSRFSINDFEGWVHHLKGDDKPALNFYAKAIPALNRQLKVTHSNFLEKFSPAYYRIGVIYKLKGEIEKAKEKFEQSIKASPPSIFAKRSQEELKELEQIERSIPFKDLM